MLLRAKLIASVQHQDVFDLVVIGGGIHGAVLAKQAAQQGHRVLLLEQSDFAAATSSRSSKMAHGGLRYLELFDFQQVFEGVKARDALYQNYPDLVKPHPFYIPVKKQDLFFRLKLGIGLTLYDLMLSNHKQKHRWLAAHNVNKDLPELSQHNLAGCFRYYDGIMNDIALVLANIMQARTSGASCLNYAKVLKLQPMSSKLTTISWQDVFTQEEKQTTARVVVNCAGPWALDFCSAPVRYSRGSHIIFSKPWNKPALFLPMPGKSRYYFIWPHFAGTMVGTTERPVSSLCQDPFPAKDEIEEIYERLKKDLPASGLSRTSAHYAFAGIRTMPLQGTKDTSRLSRKHRWLQTGSLFSLIGGKFTTAEWTVSEGLKLINKYLNVTPAKILAAPFVETFFNSDVVSKQVEAAFFKQQACTLEDVLRRRTLWEYLPDHGMSNIKAAQHIFESYLGAENFTKQLADYQKRMFAIKEILS